MHPTFDQLIASGANPLDAQAIAPNRHLPASVVLEPTFTGVRVSVRNEANKPLFGYIASPEDFKEVHMAIGVYPTMRDEVTQSLKDYHANRMLFLQSDPNLHESISALKKTIEMVETLATRITRSDDIEQIEALYQVIVSANASLVAASANR